jgi:hypothetical protein
MSGKKIVLLFLGLLAVGTHCFAIDHIGDKLLSYINLTPGTTTQSKVSSMLGTPSKIEENKKRTWWYYNNDNTSLVISWNKKSDLLERFSFSCSKVQKNAFDNAIPAKLHSGDTNIAQAIKLLGTPQNMTIKEGTQEIHYSYQNNILRLFFRNRVLVDFTLLSQN